MRVGVGIGIGIGESIVVLQELRHRPPAETEGLLCGQRNSNWLAGESSARGRTGQQKRRREEAAAAPESRAVEGKGGA